MNTVNSEFLYFANSQNKCRMVICEDEEMTVLNRIKQFLDTRPDPVSGAGYTSPYRFWQDTGIGRDTAYRMYNDPTYIPTSKALNKICSAYKIQPGTFLIWEPDDEPQTAIAGQEELEEKEPGKEPNIGSYSEGRQRTRSFLTVVLEVPESA